MTHRWKKEQRPSDEDPKTAILRLVLQHFVFDPEGDLTRAEFEDLYARARALLPDEVRS